MKLLGLEITTARENARQQRQRDLQALYSPSLWTSVLNTVQEPFSGAWQQGVTGNRTSLLSFSAVYCCVTGIASDIAKLRVKLCRDENGIWTEITANSPFLPLLRKPNHYQVTGKFIEQWILSKLLHGNTYVLKERDGRNVVRALYVLDPCRVKPLVADNGDVYYEIQMDRLSQVGELMVVPASEIIHDSMPGLFHPLIGTSPLYACAMSVQMGNSIQTNSKSFFGNRSMPGGMLTAPGKISDDTAKRLKESFEEKFGGVNVGRTFVAGDDLKFVPIAMTAEQALLVEQLKWTVADVARCFHYPEFKLGGPLPPYSGNMQALTLSYYTDCLQSLIESLEASLDDALGLHDLGQGTELDVDNLLRMDTASLYESNNKAVGGGWMAPDEARFRANLQPVPGGATPYLQQQNYSLAALEKRDAQDDPFASKNPAAAAPPPAPAARELDVDLTPEESARARKRFRERLSAA